MTKMTGVDHTHPVGQQQKRADPVVKNMVGRRKSHLWVWLCHTYESGSIHAAQGAGLDPQLRKHVRKHASQFAGCL